MNRSSNCDCNNACAPGPAQREVSCFSPGGGGNDIMYSSTIQCLLPTDVPTVTPDISTEQANPSLDNNRTGSGGGKYNDVIGLINNVSVLGFSIAAAATGNQVVTNKNGAPAGLRKPVTTGQFNVNYLLVGAGVLLIAALFLMEQEGK